MLVSLVYSSFWVQVHDPPPSLFSEAMAWQLGNFVGLFDEYNAKQISSGYSSYLRMRVMIYICLCLKRRKIQILEENSVYVRF